MKDRQMSVYCLTLIFSLGVCASAQVPTVDEMASEWLDVTQLAHMPSLHNFHEMAACAPDLLGVNHNPGGQLYAGSGPRFFKYNSLPLAKLLVDGKEMEAAKARWYPYQAVRQNSFDGIDIVSTVRMVFEDRGILYRLDFRNGRTAPSTADVVIRVNGDIKGKEAIHYDELRRLYIAYAFRGHPSRATAPDGNLQLAWKLTLKPGEHKLVEFVMADRPENETASKAAADWARNFDAVWRSSKDRWARRWQDAFTLDNSHFSGNVPVLVTDDPKIREIYYRSILTLLLLHRTNLAKSDRVFITSGERAKGTVYFWDTSLWSTVFALLEPKGMREHVELFLQCDPHGGPVLNLDTGKQDEGWYGANDYTIFRLAYQYLATTGDVAFLNRPLGGATVSQRLEALALNWKKLLRDPKDTLADYGEMDNLLECVPTYVHRVPSFNAANVWMMRKVAQLAVQRGDQVRAAELIIQAKGMSKAVLELYEPGRGVWSSLHRDGSRVEMRHCYDFATVGSTMAEDLPVQTKQEMLDFVERELLTRNWMRAQSLKDVAAATSDRPDHGPMGAYDAWPAITIDTMCLFGAWDKAVAFLRRTQAALYEGVYAQAHELYGPGRTEYDAPVRIAQRQGCMRECVGGGAFAESIITTLFGYRPEFGQPLQLLEPSISRGFSGQLLHVRRGDHFYVITSAATGGVSIREER